MPQLRELLPPDVAERRLVEPFAGGAAMFFGLQPKGALLADTNADLIALYRHVRDRVDALIDHLGAHAKSHCEAWYYQIRRSYNAGLALGTVWRAADFLYLNKTCFNGLYRVNGKGEFNASWGKHKAEVILDEPNLRAASAALQGCELATWPVWYTLGLVATDGIPSFVYLDPPYLGTFDGQAGYTPEAFGPDEHMALACELATLQARNIPWMLSVGDDPVTRDIYRRWTCHEVVTRHSVNRDGQGRVPVIELVYTSY